jgi:hypothetical protein
MALIYDILPDVNKNIIRRNFWHGKTKLITLSAIYPAPCQQSGKDGLKKVKARLKNFIRINHLAARCRGMK